MFPKEKYYFKPIYEKEILEILHAFIKWFLHLIGRHFNIRKYHESVSYFLEQHLSSREQENWVTLMLRYEFEVIYKKGNQNVVVDGL